VLVRWVSLRAPKKTKRARFWHKKVNQSRLDMVGYWGILQNTKHQFDLFKSKGNLTKWKSGHWMEFNGFKAKPEMGFKSIQWNGLNILVDATHALSVPLVYEMLKITPEKVCASNVAEFIVDLLDNVLGKDADSETMMKDWKKWKQETYLQSMTSANFSYSKKAKLDTQRCSKLLKEEFKKLV